MNQHEIGSDTVPVGCDLSHMGMLIAQMQQGNQEAWIRFVDEFRPWLCVWAAKCLPADLKCDSADIAQDAILEFLSRLPSFVFRSDCETRAYLQRIVMSKVRDLYGRGRAAKRPRVIETIPDDASHANAARQQNHECQGVVETVCRVERVEMVRIALAQLETKYRIVIGLRMFEKLTWNEIGAVLHESSDSVHQRYSKIAIPKLRKILERMLGDEERGVRD